MDALKKARKEGQASSGKKVARNETI